MKENNRGTVVVIGAGIAGLASAYYLVRDGWDVKILEKNTLDNNCSYGNAGMIVPVILRPWQPRDSRARNKVDVQ